MNLPVEILSTTNLPKVSLDHILHTAYVQPPRSTGQVGVFLFKFRSSISQFSLLLKVQVHQSVYHNHLPPNASIFPNFRLYPYFIAHGRCAGTLRHTTELRPARALCPVFHY